MAFALVTARSAAATLHALLEGLDTVVEATPAEMETLRSMLTRIARAPPPPTNDPDVYVTFTYTRGAFREEEREDDVMPLSEYLLEYTINPLYQCYFHIHGDGFVSGRPTQWQVSAVDHLRVLTRNIRPDLAVHRKPSLARTNLGRFILADIRAILARLAPAPPAAFLEAHLEALRAEACGVYERTLIDLLACDGRIAYYQRRDPSFEPDDGWANDWWMDGPGLHEYKGDTPEIAPESDKENEDPEDEEEPSPAPPTPPVATLSPPRTRTQLSQLTPERTASHETFVASLEATATGIEWHPSS